MGEGRLVVVDGRTYTRSGDGSWVGEDNLVVAVGTWGRLDRALEANGFLARRAGAPHPRTFREGVADRYLVRRAGEVRFHYRGLAETVVNGRAKPTFGVCCRCGRRPPRTGARLHAVEDKRNAGEFFEYDAGCWEGPLKAALAAALAAEADPRRAGLLAQNYHLFFEAYDPVRNVCSEADEYWDPDRPAGPHRQG